MRRTRRERNGIGKAAPAKGAKREGSGGGRGRGRGGAWTVQALGASTAACHGRIRGHPFAGAAPRRDSTRLAPRESSAGARPPQRSGTPGGEAACCRYRAIPASDGRLRYPARCMLRPRQAVLLVCCLAHRAVLGLHAPAPAAAGALSSARVLGNLRLSGGSEASPSLKDVAKRRAELAKKAEKVEEVGRSRVAVRALLALRCSAACWRVCPPVWGCGSSLAVCVRSRAQAHTRMRPRARAHARARGKKAKSVAESSSWTVFRIWFGITNKLRITGASTKVCVCARARASTAERDEDRDDAWWNVEENAERDERDIESTHTSRDGR